MKYQARFYPLAIFLLIISGCVSNQNKPTPNDVGRYLQIWHPFTQNQIIVVQQTLPDFDACQYAIKAGRKQDPIFKYSKCSHNSISEKLPFKATVINHQLGFEIKYEFKFEKDCDEFVGSIKSDNSNRHLEIKTSCNEVEISNPSSDKNINDRLRIIRNLANGTTSCTVLGNAELIEDSGEQQSYSIPCDSGNISYKCKFVGETVFHNTGRKFYDSVPRNKTKDNKIGEPACWRI